MNKVALKKREDETYKQYHIPGCHNYMRRPKNSVYLNPSNSLEHELAKARVCYELQKEKKKFITEAVENATGLRRDVVCLDDGEIFEIETTIARAKRFIGQPVNIVAVGWDLNDPKWVKLQGEKNGS